VIARSAYEIQAGRGSKYNAVAINTVLRRVLREPGRYAVVGLPCLRLHAPALSDVIARTDVKLGIIGEPAADHLTLDAATPEEIVASQRETYHFKRDIYRGRRWLRSLTGRPLPDYPGVGATASGRDRLAGLNDLIDERVHRLVGDLRCR
jgi:hypothetical protein